MILRPSSRPALTLNAGVTYADDRYMAEYFSISQSQTLTSVANLVEYDADAGFKDVHIGLEASYEINSKWALIGKVSYKRLFGDTADSPVVETADQFSALLGAT